MNDILLPPPKIKCYDSISVLQIELSTIVLAGRMFPAAIMVCPPTTKQEEDGQPWTKRALGGQSFLSWNVHIPMENGFLAAVERSHYGPKNPDPGWTWDLQVWSRTCHLREQDNEDEIWLPFFGDVVGNEIFTERRPDVGGIFSWGHCREDWLVEMIDRLGTMAAHHDRTGPQVTLKKLSDIEWEIPSRTQGVT